MDEKSFLDWPIFSMLILNDVILPLNLWIVSPPRRNNKSYLIGFMPIITCFYYGFAEVLFHTAFFLLPSSLLITILVSAEAYVMVGLSSNSYFTSTTPSTNISSTSHTQEEEQDSEKKNEHASQHTQAKPTQSGETRRMTQALTISILTGFRNATLLFMLHQYQGSEQIQTPIGRILLCLGLLGYLFFQIKDLIIAKSIGRPNLFQFQDPVTLAVQVAALAFLYLCRQSLRESYDLPLYGGLSVVHGDLVDNTIGRPRYEWVMWVLTDEIFKSLLESGRVAMFVLAIRDLSVRPQRKPVGDNAV